MGESNPDLVNEVEVVKAAHESAAGIATAMRALHRVGIAFAIVALLLLTCSLAINLTVVNEIHNAQHTNVATIKDIEKTVEAHNGQLQKTLEAQCALLSRFNIPSNQACPKATP
jgi:hypothetical protein